MFIRRTLLTLALAFAAATPSLAQDPYGSIADLKLAKAEDGKDMKSVPAPKGAIILFDGKSLDKWTKLDGKTAPSWKILDGGIAQVQNGNIITKQKFAGTFKLHVEFRVPYMPKAGGQGKGNSGVYLQGRYEVQILDSYGLKSQNNDCGGIYTVAAPRQRLQGANRLAILRHPLSVSTRRKRRQNHPGRRRHRASERHPHSRQGSPGLQEKRQGRIRHQHHRRPRRRPHPARPHHAPRPRQPRPIPQHLASARVTSRTVRA